MVETTFAEETETDLFGEQAVLCGGVTQLIRLGFETLVEAGYQPEVAYYECLHELKLIVDLIWEGGIERMHYSISDTAEYGSHAVGPKVVDEHVRENMRAALAAIRDGSFAREWIAEMDRGQPSLDEYRRALATTQLEQVGARLRALNEREVAARSPWRLIPRSAAARRSPTALDRAAGARDAQGRRLHRRGPRAAADRRRDDVDRDDAVQPQPARCSRGT